VSTGGERAVPDFEVEISAADGNYTVSARSMTGETRPTRVRFPFDDSALSGQLQALELALLRSLATVRRLTPVEERPVQEFGRQLFEFAFTPELQAHLLASSQQAEREGVPFRVQLHVGPPELATLPWEFLYDPTAEDYLCLSIPLVRYVDIPRPRQPLTVDPPLRILAMVARPEDLDRLDVDQELRRLTQALADLEAAGRVQLSWVQGQTWWDLQSALDRAEWHILHFIGHGAVDGGSGEGVLAFAAEEGGAQRVGATDLALLLAEHRSLRLVVLNSCDTARAIATDRFSSTASALMRRGIPAVVAMQYEISDQAAITFARGFYTALAAQHPVDQAVTRARRAIKLARRNTLEWATPVLYLRSPTGALFNLSDIAETPAFSLSSTTLPGAVPDATATPPRSAPVGAMSPRTGPPGEKTPPVTAETTSAPRISRRRLLQLGAAVGGAGLAGAGLWFGLPLVFGRPLPPTRTEELQLVTVDDRGERQPSETQPVEVFDLTVGTAVFRFAVIPAGPFQIGSPNNEPQRRTNEGPQRYMQIGKFAFGRTAVTQAQWAAVIDAVSDTGAQTLPRRPSFFHGDDLPVETVNWYQATEFCRRLSTATG
jgi:hypothetical protein